MISSPRLIGLVTLLVLLLGGGWIIYSGRPVMKIEEATPSPVVETASTTTAQAEAPTPAPAPAPAPTPTPTSAPAPTPAPTPTPTPAPAPKGTYTLADVALHATEADCWTAINGTVYDLTSWVSRHPGGTRPIANLCGKDGGASFERKHGGESRPQAALILLKIGVLR